MDPLSISAAVTGFASLAGQIISTLRDYVDGVKSAANEAQSLLQEVTAFRQVLEHFGGFILTNHLDKHEFQGSSALVEAIGACKNHLENLHRKLEDTSNTISNSRKSTGLVARIKWPFKKGELQETVGGLHRLANIFQLWMTMNTHELMSGTFSIVQSQLDKNWQNMESLVTDMKSLPIAMSSMLQQRMSEISQMKTLLLELSHSNLIEHRNFSRVMREVQERLQDDEIQKMMPWISTLQPHKRHQDIQQQRLEGTGGWFLLQPEFEKWRDDELAGDGNKSCVLACSGIPGAGKSVICSLVFDHLDEKFNFDTEENACVVCLYCDYGNEKNQTSVNMIGVLLKQVIARLNKSGSLPQHTISTLRKYLKEQKHVNLQDACQMLVETVKQLRKFYVCIDALDECNLHHRRELVQSLERISGECSRQTSVRIFFTARPHIGLRDMMKCNPGLGPVEYLYLRAQTDDIKKYVNSIIDEDDNGECMTNTLRSQILDRIVYNSDGMFLLPTLQIHTVLARPTISKRRAALFNMPINLNAAFASTITRIKNHQSERSHQALEVLKWIFLAQRPLTVMELLHALSVTTDHSDIYFGYLPLAYDQTLNWDNFLSERSLIDWCLGLVIIDEETSTVRLVHKSLHDYLTSLFEKGEIFPDGHSQIAHTCLQYMLLHDDIYEIDATARKVNKAIKDQRRKKFCFLDYATNYFGCHLSDTVPCTSDMIRALFPRTVNLRRISTGLRSMFLYPFHELLLKESCCAHEYDSTKQIHLRLQFAISWGLKNVFIDLLNLLGQGIDLDTKLGSSTMLLQASRVGQESIVCILLARTVDLDFQDSRGKTALSWASENGHESVVRQILQAGGIYPISMDCHGEIKRRWLAKSILNFGIKLPRGEGAVHINWKDDDGRTALSYASENGHESVVKLLLQVEGIDINSMGFYGETALSCASGNGHDSVVKLLLQAEGLNINSMDRYGLTALSLASAYGHKSVVELLLQAKDIDINSTNRYGLTALSLASRNGHEAIEKLLVTVGAIAEWDAPPQSYRRQSISQPRAPHASIAAPREWY